MPDKKNKGFPASNVPLVVVLVIAGALAVLVWLFVGLQPSDAGSVTAIDNERLRELVADGARLVDVRTTDEYERGHIAGAELVPVWEIVSAAESWDRSQPIVVYCATEARSADAAEVLASMGFDVYDLTSGVIAWDEDLTTEVDVASDPSGTSGQASGLPVMLEFLTDS